MVCLLICMFLLRILVFFSFHKLFSSRDRVLEICPRPWGQLEEFLVALALVSYHLGLGLDIETLDILARTEVCSLLILGEETDLQVLPCTFYVVRSECSQQVQPAQLTAACVAEYMACSLIRTQIAWTEVSFLISRRVGRRRLSWIVVFQIVFALVLIYASVLGLVSFSVIHFRYSVKQTWSKIWLDLHMTLLYIKKHVKMQW